MDGPDGEMREVSPGHAGKLWLRWKESLDAFDFSTLSAELSQGLRLPGRVRPESSSSTHQLGPHEGEGAFLKPL